MRRRFADIAGTTVMLGGFVLAAVVTVALVLPSAGQPALGAGWRATSTGPLGPADIDFLIKVRQAGLWEIPTGQQAQTSAQSEKVKDVGRHLVEDHTKLDIEVRKVAAQLGVDLPSAASPDQQRWMAQLSSKTGASYDRDFANLLRAAHGKVFTVVAAVRAGTRNDEIRKFAQKAVVVVMRHMTLLESTGLVDHFALPEPPTPSPLPGGIK
ncbi:DUF4142 domain-containing protein [Nonomuraea sp. NPDC050663]|uniref:DUF4142 domain-containing protein n=1 Tax=Nonomuraea sp. NPDC050663 TaxID=3364370 RepID=UPI0037B6F25A